MEDLLVTRRNHKLPTYINSQPHGLEGWFFLTPMESSIHVHFPCVHSDLLTY